MIIYGREIKTFQIKNHVHSLKNINDDSFIKLNCFIFKGYNEIVELLKTMSIGTLMSCGANIDFYETNLEEIKDEF